MAYKRILTVEIEIPSNSEVFISDSPGEYKVKWSPLEASKLLLSLEALLVGKYICIAKAIDEER